MECEILFPGSTPWVHDWTDQEYCSGSHLIAAAFGSPPILIRVEGKFFDLLASLKDARGKMSR